MVKILLKEKSTTDNFEACRILPLNKGNATTALPFAIKEEELKLKCSETALFHYHDGKQLNRFLAIGLDKDERSLTADDLRRCGGELARQLKKQKIMRAVCEITAWEAAVSEAGGVQALFEGLMLGDYAFLRYKSEVKPELELEISFEVEAAKLSEMKSALKRAAIIANAVNWSRDLTNIPGNDLSPEAMAKEAELRFAGSAVKVSLLSELELAREKLGGIIAVGQGSKNPPVMIVLNYQGDSANQETLALIGKGVTFDSGGLSLKPGDNMGEMKGDMAGGAAVLAAMEAIALLELPLNVLGIVPCAENMPSGTAFRPGDVVTAGDGTTIEIVNTDAEGRLLLADAICYARRLGATKLVDIATLTGACMVALGKVAAGVVGNETELTKLVLAAADFCGEKMWQFPNYEEYDEMLKSQLADLKNTGGRWGGAITAGMFLKHFAGTLPWAHIDIAGLELSDKEGGYLCKGATGFGARSLIQLAEALASC